MIADALDGYYRALYSGLLPGGRSPVGDHGSGGTGPIWRSAPRPRPSG